MNEDPRDELARLRAGADQAREAGKEWAESIGVYFKALTANGMTREEALQLTINFQSLMFGMAMMGGGEAGA